MHSQHHEGLFNIDLEFIEKVIHELSNKFVKGSDHNKTLLAMVEKDVDLAARFGTDTMSGNLFIKDETILDDYNANRIPNSYFIASAGPKCDKEIATFIDNTVYHPQIPVHHIVALGSKASPRPSCYFEDFSDYALTEQSKKYGRHDVSVKLISGIATSSPSQIFINAHIESQLTIGNEILNVTTFSLRDNRSLNLTRLEEGIDDPLTPEGLEARKEMVWKLFEKSLHEPILVHCSAGVGRTGHYILMMRVLANYERIFAEGNAVKSAKLILNLLKEMRSVRPGLVNTEEQFFEAIRNAHVLYDYALKKKYIQAAKFAELANASLSEEFRSEEIASTVSLLEESCSEETASTVEAGEGEKEESDSHSVSPPKVIERVPSIPAHVRFWQHEQAGEREQQQPVQQKTQAPKCTSKQSYTPTMMVKPISKPAPVPMESGFLTSATSGPCLIS